MSSLKQKIDRTLNLGSRLNLPPSPVAGPVSYLSQAPKSTSLLGSPNIGHVLSSAGVGTAVVSSLYKPFARALPGTLSRMAKNVEGLGPLGVISKGFGSMFDDISKGWMQGIQPFIETTEKRAQEQRIQERQELVSFLPFGQETPQTQSSDDVQDFVNLINQLPWSYQQPQNQVVREDSNASFLEELRSIQDLFASLPQVQTSAGVGGYGVSGGYGLGLTGVYEFPLASYASGSYGSGNAYSQYLQSDSYYGLGYGYGYGYSYEPDWQYYSQSANQQGEW